MKKKIFIRILPVPKCVYTLLTGLIIITTFAASAANRYSVASTPWALPATWSATSGGAAGASVPVAGDVVFIEGGRTVTIGANAACATLNIASGSTLTVGGFTLTVSGATSLSGTMTFNGAAGTKTFTGNVVINGTGNWNETAAAVFAFGGNLQNGGIFTGSTGTHTFSGAARTISGANPIAIPSLTISGTTANNGTLTVSTSLAGGSVLTNGATGTLNYGGLAAIAPPLTATAAGNTVNYTRSGNQTVKPTTYSNLTVSGSGAKTTTGVTVNGIMTRAGTASVSAVPTYGASSTLRYNGSAAQTSGNEFPASFAGTGGVVSNNPLGVTMNAIKTVSNLTVNAGAVFNTGATSTWTLTVSGATSVSGTLNLTNAADKTFTGDITVNSGGTLSMDNTSSAIIAGNITVSSGGLMKHYVNYASANLITMTGNLDISGTYDYTGFAPAIFMNAPSGTRTINTGTTSVFYLLLRTATYNAIGPVTVDGPFYAMWNVNAGSFHTNGQTIIANWGVVNAGGTLFVDGGSLTINGANGGLLSGFAAGGANAAVTVSSGTVNTTGINMGASPLVSTFTHSGGTITTTSLTIDNSSTYTCSNSPTLTINGTLTLISGTFTTATAGAPAINISGNLAVGSAGTFTNVAASNPVIAINGSVTNAGVLTPVGTVTINVKGDWTNNGTSTATGGTVTFNGTGNQAIGGTSITTFGSLVINPSAGITVSVTNNISVLSNLTVSAGIFSANNFNMAVGGNWTNNSATTGFTAGTGTVTFNGSGAQAVAGSFVTTFNNLTISNTGSTVTSGINSSVSGNLSVSSGTFDLGSFTANRATAGGTLTVSNGATLKIGGTNTLPSNYSTHSIGATSNIQYSGTTQSVVVLNSAQDYGNLIISGSGTKTLAGTNNVAGNLTVSAGTFDLGSFTINRTSAGGTLSVASSATLKIGGTNTFPSNYSTHSIAFASIVEYAGTNQVVGVLNGAQEYSGLTISGSGTKTLTADLNVAGNLTLTSGTITTGAFTLYSKPTGNVFRVSGWVIGNLKRRIQTGAPTRIFDVGDATNYTPINLVFASVTTAGDLTASTTANDHVNISISTIDPSKSVNRNWTLTNSGIAFTTYSVTLTFVAGDLDAGAITSNFIVGKYSAGWSYPIVGTITATSIQATGLAAFSDFQVGEILPVVVPVRFTSVKATQKNEDIQVKWDIAEESGIREYGIERSVNGINFIKVGAVASKGNNTIESYDWLDADPLAGMNYYRIRAVEPGGIYFLSKMAVVKMETNVAEVRVFPNPIKNGRINLYINSKEKGQYTVVLSGHTGQRIIKLVIDHPGGSLSRIISLNKRLAGGIYQLQVTNTNRSYDQTIMIE